jgi:hypothetical protein
LIFTTTFVSLPLFHQPFSLSLNVSFLYFTCACLSGLAFQSEHCSLLSSLPPNQRSQTLDSDESDDDDGGEDDESDDGNGEHDENEDDEDADEDDANADAPTPSFDQPPPALFLSTDFRSSRS